MTPGRPKQTMNLKRAAWAETALIAFAQETGQLGQVYSRDRDEVVRDLLCDLMHFSDLRGVVFVTALKNGTELYRIELAQDGEQT